MGKKVSARQIRGVVAVCVAIAKQSKPLKVNRTGKTKEDPTGQARNRNRSTKRLITRLNRAERQVKALFRAIPKTSRRQTKIRNAEQTTIYDYEFTAEDQAVFAASVLFILNQELLETQTGLMPFDWYWKSDIELPYRQGTAEEVRDFNRLVEEAVLAGVLVGGLPPQTVPIEQVLLSEPYRQALASAQVENFQTIKTMSERTAAQVMQRINAGIQSGQTPTFIVNEITERFGVSRASAKRIAETEINKAFNNAKLDATRILGDRTGLRAAVLHISALLPTTRAHHAARHGNIYTVADQLQWWDTGTNRINCKCSIQSMLIDAKGNVINKEFQDQIKAQKKFFDS